MIDRLFELLCSAPLGTPAYRTAMADILAAEDGGGNPEQLGDAYARREREVAREAFCRGFCTAIELCREVDFERK